MKNKGFTLVELLGTITIIGIIFAIAIPSVTYVIRASKKKAYRAHENSMEKAATAYLINNDNAIPSSGSCYILLKTLIDEKYIEPLDDPDDKLLSCIVEDEEEPIDLSYVVVERKDTTSNIGLTYSAYLKCSKYSTSDVTKPVTMCPSE